MKEQTTHRLCTQPLSQMKLINNPFAFAGTCMCAVQAWSSKALKGGGGGVGVLLPGPRPPASAAAAAGAAAGGAGSGGARTGELRPAAG